MADHVKERITRNEVARRLGCSIASVRRMEGAELHPATGEGDVRYFDPDEVAAVARTRASGADKTAALVLAPLPADEAVRPVPEPPPPRRRKSWLEREQEAAALRFSWDSIMDRFDREADAREAVEERRQARRDRHHEAFQKRLDALFPRREVTPSPAPPPAPAVDEQEEALLALASELNELMGIDDE
jgi:hypothetical protein